jgi:hypothetical protein
MRHQLSNAPLRRQVFISHTGQDAVASTFATVILKDALQARGLSVYLDINNLAPGCNWPSELVQAATDSAVVVVVISKTYPEQLWCMMELDLALHARTQLPQPYIIPVFYDTVEEVMKGEQQLVDFWSSEDRLRKLSRDERGTVDAARWAGNITAMKDRLQHVRLEALTGKDKEGAAAKAVAEEALKHIPILERVPSKVQFDDQEAELLELLKSVDGLWLHGIGESQGGCSASSGCAVASTAAIQRHGWAAMQAVQWPMLASPFRSAGCGHGSGAKPVLAHHGSSTLLAHVCTQGNPGAGGASQ